MGIKAVVTIGIIGFNLVFTVSIIGNKPVFTVRIIRNRLVFTIIVFGINHVFSVRILGPKHLFIGICLALIVILISVGRDCNSPTVRRSKVIRTPALRSDAVRYHTEPKIWAMIERGPFGELRVKRKFFHFFGSDLGQLPCQQLVAILLIHHPIQIWNGVQFICANGMLDNIASLHKPKGNK